MAEKRRIKMDIFEKTRELGEMIQESEQMKKAKDLEAKQQRDRKSVV